MKNLKNIEKDIKPSEKDIKPSGKDIKPSEKDIKPSEKDIKPSALEYLRQNEGLIKNEIVLRLKTMFDADEIKILDLNKTVINVFDGFEKNIIANKKNIHY